MIHVQETIQIDLDKFIKVLIVLIKKKLLTLKYF